MIRCGSKTVTRIRLTCTLVKGQPTAIIMKTVKGKGVSFMENNVAWHGSAPNDEQYAVAMADLEKVGEALCQK